MIGTSIDTVKSWELGRSSEISPLLAQRIFASTGAQFKDKRTVLYWKSGKPYQRKDLENWRKTFGRGDEAQAKMYAALAADEVRLIFLAAVTSGHGEVPGLWHSFQQWALGATRDFQISQRVDLLRKSEANAKNRKR